MDIQVDWKTLSDRLNKSETPCIILSPSVSPLSFPTLNLFLKQVRKGPPLGKNNLILKGLYSRGRFVNLHLSSQALGLVTLDGQISSISS